MNLIRPQLTFVLPIALALLLTALATNSPAEKDTSAMGLQCAGCSQSITGRYITALGKDWHPEHFACASCDRPFGDEPFFEHEDHPYCQACYNQKFSPRCAGCGEPISGRYITALDSVWHPQHFVCASCGRPFHGSQFMIQDQQPYCKTCYHDKFTEKCAICGQPLTGKYVASFWGENYHVEHQDQLEPCSSCQRPICDQLTGGGFRYEDGRTMCAICRDTAIDSLGVGEQLLLQVKRDLEEIGFTFDNVDLPLRLIDHRELTELTGTHRTNGRTQTKEETLNGKIVEREVEEIVILYGLPQIHFAAVAAHELGHVYLFQRKFSELPSSVEEGLCELMAYLWLRRQQDREAAFQIELKKNSDDAIYGDGFRAALAALENSSPDLLFEYVHQHKRFPR